MTSALASSSNRDKPVQAIKPHFCRLHIQLCCKGGVAAPGEEDSPQDQTTSVSLCVALALGPCGSGEGTRVSRSLLKSF